MFGVLLELDVLPICTFYNTTLQAETLIACSFIENKTLVAWMKIRYRIRRTQFIGRALYILKPNPIFCFLLHATGMLLYVFCRYPLLYNFIIYHLFYALFRQTTTELCSRGMFWIERIHVRSDAIQCTDNNDTARHCMGWT